MDQPAAWTVRIFHGESGELIAKVREDPGTVPVPRMQLVEVFLDLATTLVDEYEELEDAELAAEAAALRAQLGPQISEATDPRRLRQSWEDRR